MRLVSFKVDALNSGETSLTIDFHDDLTIFVGRNGSGKTTILKLIWFMISGNLERIPGEIDFKSAELLTDRYLIIFKYSDPIEPSNVSRIARRVVKRSRTKNKPYIISYFPRKDGVISNEGIEYSSSESDWDIDDLNAVIASAGSSVFFPTFRRFEGGYTIDSLSNSSNDEGRINKLGEIISEISNRISVGNHKFIMSFSASDIKHLIANKYSQAAAQYNTERQKIGDQVIQDIKSYKYSVRMSNDSRSADDLIDSIEKRITEMDVARGKQMEPIFDLGNFVNRILKKNIDIFVNLDISHNNESIPIESLSAGEKQMVSFMCYNAFYEKSPIFIDEPELSLNGDWQRILFRELIKQNPSNQYIVSTHSPFIYSAFKDKAVNLNNRGDLGD